MNPATGARGKGSWTPDGTHILASLGVVNLGRMTDVKIGWIDPTTGEITPTGLSGAMASLKATR